MRRAGFNEQAARESAARESAVRESAARESAARESAARTHHQLNPNAVDMEVPHE